MERLWPKPQCNLISATMGVPQWELGWFIFVKVLSLVKNGHPVLAYKTFNRILHQLKVWLVVASNHCKNLVMTRCWTSKTTLELASRLLSSYTTDVNVWILVIVPVWESVWILNNKWQTLSIKSGHWMLIGNKVIKTIVVKNWVTEKLLLSHLWVLFNLSKKKIY